MIKYPDEFIDQCSLSYMKLGLNGKINFSAFVDNAWYQFQQATKLNAGWKEMIVASSHHKGN